MGVFFMSSFFCLFLAFLFSSDLLQALIGSVRLFSSLLCSSWLFSITLAIFVSSYIFSPFLGSSRLGFSWLFSASLCSSWLFLPLIVSSHPFLARLDSFSFALAVFATSYIFSLFLALFVSFWFFLALLGYFCIFLHLFASNRPFLALLKSSQILILLMQVLIQATLEGTILLYAFSFRCRAIFVCDFYLFIFLCFQHHKK